MPDERGDQGIGFLGDHGDVSVDAGCIGLILLFKPGLAAQQAKAIKAAPVRPRGEPAP